MGSEAVAADLDILREAVGDERLNYYGVSYGTLIGAIYADRHLSRRLPGPRLRRVARCGRRPLRDPARRRCERAPLGREFDALFAEFVEACGKDQPCPLGDDPDEAAGRDRAARLARDRAAAGGLRLAVPGDRGMGGHRDRGGTARPRLLALSRRRAGARDRRRGWQRARVVRDGVGRARRRRQLPGLLVWQEPPARDVRRLAGADLVGAHPRARRSSRSTPLRQDPAAAPSECTGWTGELRSNLLVDAEPAPPCSSSATRTTP